MSVYTVKVLRDPTNPPLGKWDAGDRPCHFSGADRAYSMCGDDMVTEIVCVYCANSDAK